MKKLNNKGFSLIELLVAVAILAILMTSVCLFIANSAGQVKDAKRDAKVQQYAKNVYDRVVDSIQQATTIGCIGTTPSHASPVCFVSKSNLDEINNHTAGFSITNATDATGNSISPSCEEIDGEECNVLAFYTGQVIDDRQYKDEKDRFAITRKSEKTKACKESTIVYDPKSKQIYLSLVESNLTYSDTSKKFISASNPSTYDAEKYYKMDCSKEDDFLLAKNCEEFKITFLTTDTSAMKKKASAAKVSITIKDGRFKYTASGTIEFKNFGVTD